MHKFIFERSLYKCLLNQFMLYHVRPDQVTKRGILLEKMIVDKDRRKNWHFNIMNNKTKCRNVFEKVHKPSRRRNVLNALFIRNITDVISTGEVIPEILGYGIEITGVKISPCCKILNVFWQVHTRHYEDSDSIAKSLGTAAPKIRAELISRNVMGHVPYIYFLRDSTNARIAGFEEALARLDLSNNSDSQIVPDDSFVKDIYSFKTPKVKNDNISVSKIAEKTTYTPNLCPPDMKSDVFGLDRDKIMAKILTLKKKEKKYEQSAVVTQEMLEKGDLFSKIPGVCFEPDTTRGKILKQFQIERKILMQKKAVSRHQDEDYKLSDDYNDTECDSYEDYLEEDNTRKH